MAQVITLVQWKLPLITAAQRRVCKKCNTEKDKEEFKVDHSCSDNRRNICIQCERERCQKNKADIKKRRGSSDSNKFFNF